MSARRGDPGALAGRALGGRPRRSLVACCPAPHAWRVAVWGPRVGAAGALEAAAVLLSMQHSLIPPTANTVNIDSEMAVDVVIGSPRPWEPGPTMSNNFGFGGHNGSIIIGTGTN